MAASDLRHNGWLNRRTLAWASYDVASSTYLGIVPIVLFPVYFRTVVVPGAAGDLAWGFTVAAALAIAGLSAPLVGIAADRTGSRGSLLGMATIVCCGALAGLAVLNPIHAGALAVIFVVAHASYLLANSLYESYLPHIADPSESGRISCFGWAAGFVGGVIAIIAIFPLARYGTAPEFIDQYRTSFLVIAALFALFAMPALWGLKYIVEKGSTVSRNHASLRETLRSWREHREVTKLLLAFYLINDAMVTISVFAANYFRIQFGASVEQLLILILIYHALSLPATLVFGVLADRWTHRRAIALSLSIWIVALAVMGFGEGAWVPTVAVILFSLVYGSTNAMLRSLLSHMVPTDRAAEFFGFNTLAGRLSAALGPLLFGIVATASGSQRLALASILVFIVGGGVLLAMVRLPGIAETNR